MSQRRVPIWMTIIIILSALPLAGFPLMLSRMTEVVGEARVLLWLYPLYVVTAAYLAWQCYGRRTEMTWVLLVLLWLSHVAIHMI